MFDVLVTDEVVAYAQATVGAGVFARRGRADGTVQQQVVGLVGQTVIHDLFGVPRPRDNGKPDGGVDFLLDGMRVDVKTMGRKVRPLTHYVNNLSGLQIRYPTDAYIFCSLNHTNRVLTVCGWITRIEVVERAVVNPAGTLCKRGDGSTFVTKSDLYEIPSTELYPSPDLLTMRSMMELQAAFFAVAVQRGKTLDALAYARAA